MEETIIEALRVFNPTSIFLYGSRGRRDNKPDSDYEVGVIFEDDKYVRRSEIHEKVQLEKVRIYPFKLSEIKNGSLDTPFQKTIYLKEIVIAGKTIYGEKVIENIDPPQITTLDLIQRIRFDMGYSLAAILSMRAGDVETASEEFSKSCMFGLRCLEILKLNIFPVGYEDIYKLRLDLNLEPRHISVIDAAYSLRSQQAIDEDAVFENISFLNYIETEIMTSFEQKGITKLA